MKSKFALVSKIKDPLFTNISRPQLTSNDNGCCVITQIGLNNYLVKLTQINPDPNDIRTIVDVDDTDVTLSNTTLPNGIKSRMINWLNNNGFSSYVTDFTNTVTSFRQALLFFLNTAGQNIDESSLLNNYQTGDLTIPNKINKLT